MKTGLWVTFTDVEAAERESNNHAKLLYIQLNLGSYRGLL